MYLADVGVYLEVVYKEKLKAARGNEIFYLLHNGCTFVIAAS
jgi:hypothetical protein